MSNIFWSQHLLAPPAYPTPHAERAFPVANEPQEYGFGEDFYLQETQGVDFVGGEVGTTQYDTAYPGVDRRESISSVASSAAATGSTLADSRRSSFAFEVSLPSDEYPDKLRRESISSIASAAATVTSAGNSRRSSFAEPWPKTTFTLADCLPYDKLTFSRQRTPGCNTSLNYSDALPSPEKEVAPYVDVVPPVDLAALFVTSPTSAYNVSCAAAPSAESFQNVDGLQSLGLDEKELQEILSMNLPQVEHDARAPAALLEAPVSIPFSEIDIAYEDTGFPWSIPPQLEQSTCTDQLPASAAAVDRSIPADVDVSSSYRPVRQTVQPKLESELDRRRAKNTEAARRSRQKKANKMRALEERCRWLEEYSAGLERKYQAMARQNEEHTLQEQELQSRVKNLEALLRESYKRLQFVNNNSGAAFTASTANTQAPTPEKNVRKRSYDEDRLESEPSPTKRARKE
ncbi:hypothetical protein BC832DRAFT_306832 [Gaertneriomyces semiglobifer]|nr:hypothetical protein BC832DRAFT_306832 [Gaertneriomyces semiglobifer]